MAETKQDKDRRLEELDRLTRRRLNRRRRWLVVAIGAGGLVVSVAIWRALWSRDLGMMESQVATRFTAEAEVRIRAIQRQFQKDAEATDYLLAFYAGSREVERREFQKFTLPVLLRDTDIQVLQWVPRVSATGQQTVEEARAAHEEAGKEEGLLDYQILERTPDGRLARAGRRDEYFPVYYAEPPDTDQVAFGLDLSTEPVQREALMRARDEGQVVVSGRILLQGQGTERPGVLIVGPIYRKEAPTETLEQRRENLAGYVAMMISLDAVVERALSDFAPVGMTTEIFDQYPAAPERTLYVRALGSRVGESAAEGTGAADGERQAQKPRGLHHEVTMAVPGRKWLIRCTPTDAYFGDGESWQPHVMLAAGVLITILLTMYLSALIGRTSQVEELVDRRAAQLKRAKERLEQEVADRKRAEEVIRDSQALYSSLVENLPVHVIRKDLGGRFTFANQSFCDLLGRPLEQILGFTDFDLYPAEQANKFRRDDRRVIETGKIFEDVEENERYGKLRYVQVMKSPVHDASGKTIGVQVIFWDVTARKQAEEALAYERFLLSTLMDNSPDHIYFKDAESHFIRISKGLADFYGLESPSDAIGNTDFDFYDPQRAEQYLADEREVMSTGKAVVDKEEEQTVTGGNAGWVSTTKLPLYDNSGRVTGTFGISRNITKRKRAEEGLLKARGELEQRVRERTAELEKANRALQAEISERKRAEGTLRLSETRLRQIIDLVPHMIFAKDPEGRFLLANRATAAAYDLTVEELTGKNHADVHPDQEELQRMLEDDLAVIKSGRLKTIPQESFVGADGNVRLLQTIKIPYTASGTSESGILGVAIDVTELKQAEEELRRAHDELELRVQQRTAELANANTELELTAEALRVAKDTAETANRAKGDFLAHMSHEIRTPMNAIIGMTELVLETRLSLDQREYLSAVQESGEVLLSLINDVLDFSKIEAGKLGLDPEVFDLHETVGDTMKWLALRAHAKGLELVSRIAPDVPAGVVGDSTRLRQIIVNLVGNAIKFTEQGEVILDVSTWSQSDGELVAHFAVRDTGIGIPQEKRGTIFGAFEQADNTTTRRFGGSGLGLAIASRLVGLMGGRLWVESEVGRGSTFHFTARFELAPAETAEAPPQRSATVAGTRVLVVDDNATNRRILEEMLRHWEMEPRGAAGAREALQMLREARQSGEAYGLVLTDANMPEMDGFALVERIKQDEEIDNTVIMMLTSGDRPGDIARCERLGIESYLTKPVKQSELFDAVLVALGIAAVEKWDLETADATAEAPMLPLRILLAEDSLVGQKLAVGLLQRQGHTVKVANHGREALAALESETFDLVLLDVQMPEMDGLEAAGAIRAREKQTGGHIPIIAMTAHAMKGDRQRCLQAGMDEYVTKPIRVKQLFDTIRAALGISGESSLAPDRVCATEDTLDWSEALRTVRGDRELLKVVVETFLEESPRLLGAIHRALAEGDPSGLRITAHTLKGSMRYFGGNRAFDLAFEIEKIGQGGNLEDAEPAIAALEEEMARFLPALVDYVQKNQATDDA